MSLKASALKSNEAQKKSISKEVNSILGYIDDELKNAHDTGKHSINISVPITFAIPYMSNRAAQRIVYYKILDSLLEREFHVEIILDDDRNYFCITWLSADELREIEHQHTVLAKHTKKNVAKLKLAE